MILGKTELAGCYVVKPEYSHDERGFFARTFCAEEFAGSGLNPCIAQCSISYNRRRGTLRGLHYQATPHAEAKLVRCTRGAIWDVAVDVREESATFGKWTAVELSAESHLAIYIPEGFAHGFLTLEDDTEIVYQISVPFQAESFQGIRWDDSALAIRWPEPPRLISERDRALPSLSLTRPSPEEPE